MAEKKLNIKVSTTGAGKAKQKVSGLSSSISKMGKAVGIASAAYFGARGLISGFGSVIELAGIQEQAEKKLEVALGFSSKALLDHASALQEMTTFGDEAIIGVQASLAAFIDNEDQIKLATQATLDLSVAMGMDLKAAGDLVAKTLGSSMNAMSRYGVEVKGAVGSTERLESLTNNVADLFGGQASAQADTMAGSIEQMKNSVGDAGEAIGELLSPSVIKMSKILKSFAEDAVGFIDWFDGINTNEEVLDNFNEQTDKASRVLNEYAKSLNITTDDSKSLSENLANLIEKAKEINEGEFAKGPAFSESARAMRDAKDAAYDLDNALIAFKATALPLGEKPLVIIEPEQIDILEDIIIDMSIMNGLMEETFGTGKKVEDTMKDQIQLAGTLSSALQTTFDPDLGAGEAFKGFVLQLMSAMQGVILASNVVSEALTFTFTGPLGIGAAVAALVGLEAAKAGVRSLEFAETGFDGIVNSPTMFMTGEGNKAERVSVTPLQGPNINGPQGGITLNIQGNMIGNESFVRDVLIPEISNAKRMNLA